IAGGSHSKRLHRPLSKQLNMAKYTTARCRRKALAADYPAELRLVVSIHPGADLRQHLGQQRLDLRSRHAWADPAVVENVEQVLIVDVEETHLHVVIEHRPR